ncbi:hypothetical protein [Halorubellus salinus]|uniref:hypothetical protein n=1 Tax=Halorubellus salinus TaxID=755309 RepID=UPI001D06CB45|nr:hypothetical protein [Halorubellus salinus]
MSTAKALHSIRRLLAFACLLLSLVLVGVGELVLTVDYSSLALSLIFAGILATVASGLWLVSTLTASQPANDGSSQTADA